MKTFGKILSVLFMCLPLSCAKANYENIPTPNTETGPQEKVCNLKMAKIGVCAVIEWEKKPTDSETGSFLLRFSALGESENPQPSFSPSVVLWMPSMGHGSSPVKVELISDGLYRVSQVFFVMPGEWEIRIQAKSGNQVLDETVEKIQL